MKQQLRRKKTWIEQVKLLRGTVIITSPCCSRSIAPAFRTCPHPPRHSMRKSLRFSGGRFLLQSSIGNISLRRFETHHPGQPRRGLYQVFQVRGSSGRYRGSRAYTAGLRQVSNLNLHLSRPTIGGTHVFSTRGSRFGG